MRRTFNYTGRSRIAQKKVDIRLRWSTDSLSPTFIAEVDLDDLELNPDAKVYIDAARQDIAAWMRFDFGTVAKMNAPSDTLLSEFNRESKPKFYIKVVDEEDYVGKVLADSIAIQAIDPEEVSRKSKGMTLIHVVTGDLEDQIWKLKMPEQDNDVVDLVLNERIEEVKSIFNEDWAAPMMLPNAVREILIYIIAVLKEEYNDTGDQWYSIWLQFMKKYYDVVLPSLTDPNSDDEMQERLMWVEDAVNAFSNKMGFRSILEQQLHGGLEDEI